MNGSNSSQSRVCLVIVSYCSDDPGDTTIVVPTDINHQIGAEVQLTCASGYGSGPNGAPVYDCVASTVNEGKWELKSGSCVGVHGTLSAIHFH